MGEIIELNSADINEIIDEISENNDDLADWNQKDERIRDELLNIFYGNDNGEDEKSYPNFERGHYGTGKRASLYIKDSRKHICAKNIVLDFIKIIFTPSTWKCVKAIYCGITGIHEHDLNIGNIIVLIDKIKKAITNNIVKLEKESFCFYLKMVTNFREHSPVTLEELLEWLPEDEEECSYSTLEFGCQFRKNEKCTLKGKTNHKKIVSDELHSMVERKILLEYLSEEDKYKIN